MSTNIATSFNLPLDFKEYLDKQAKSSNKTRTQYVIDAVTAYASEGKTITQEQLQQIEQLQVLTASLSKELQEIKTLVFQILKNQQG